MWHVGVHRHVWIMGKIVLKFPRFPLGSLTETLKIFGPSRLGFSLMWSQISRGFAENINEVHCYYKTKHPLLAKMYLPLIVVNVYKRETGVGHFCFEAEELYAEARKSGDRELFKALAHCSHTFDQRENFAYSRGTVKILDYGENGIANLLIRHGDKVKKFLISKVEVK